MGATALGIGLVVAGAATATANPLGLVVIALLLVLAPLVIARRWPKVGSWLAMAMLVACPFALLMIIGSTDRTLIASHWRCGTPQAMLWMTVMPTTAALLALGVGPLWRMRRSVARAWRPASSVVLLISAGLLMVGAQRHLELGPLHDAASVLDRTHQVTVPPTAPWARVTVTAQDLALERSCTGASCEMTVAAIDPPEPGVPPASTPVQWSLHAPLTIHRLGRWRILEGERHQFEGPAPHAVFDVEQGQLVNLTVRDVADWFGPPLTALALLLLAIAAVSASLWVPAATPLIWQRLGARDATTTDTLEEAIARRSMHVAVVLVASLPLLACAVVGLVV